MIKPTSGIKMFNSSNKQFVSAHPSDKSTYIYLLNFLAGFLLSCIWFYTLGMRTLNHPSSVALPLNDASQHAMQLGR